MATLLWAVSFGGGCDDAVKVTDLELPPVALWLVGEGRRRRWRLWSSERSEGGESGGDRRDDDDEEPRVTLRLLLNLAYGLDGWKLDWVGLAELGGVGMAGEELPVEAYWDRGDWMMLWGIAAAAPAGLARVLSVSAVRRTLYDSGSGRRRVLLESSESERPRSWAAMRSFCAAGGDVDGGDWAATGEAALRGLYSEAPGPVSWLGSGAVRGSRRYFLAWRICEWQRLVGVREW